MKQKLRLQIIDFCLKEWHPCLNVNCQCLIQLIPNGTKCLTQILTPWGWNLRNKLQWNSNRNSNIFVQENAFENVIWKMAVILYRPQYANQTDPCTIIYLARQWTHTTANIGHQCSIFHLQWNKSMRWVRDAWKKSLIALMVNRHIISMRHVVWWPLLEL